MIINSEFKEKLDSVNFWEQEERFGYVVTEKMKKVWAVELDLLREFISVCDKYNLQYFADSGTLLGAVRHKGFIPWDDDIDVVMTRKDYDRLLEIAPQEFKSPYLFQSAYLDNDFHRTHIQIRNTSTTGIRINEMKNARFNQGIFLDVFPLDNVPDALKDRKRFLNEVKYRGILRRIKFQIFKPKRHLVRFASKILGIFISEKYVSDIAFDKLIAKYKDSEGQCIDHIAFSEGFESKTFKYQKDWFADSMELDFEIFKIRCPKDAEKVLTALYGKDYMKPVTGSGSHGDMIFEPDIPYEEYIRLEI